MQILIFLLLTIAVPVVINKSTESGRLDWIHPYLREIWMALLLIGSLYLLAQPNATELIMRNRDGWLGYAVIFAIGGILLCIFWAITGFFFPDKTKPSDNNTLVDKQTKQQEPSRPIISTTFVSLPIIGIDPRDKRNTELILGLNIINTGEPTALFGFELRVRFPDGVEIVTPPLRPTVKPLEIIDDKTGKKSLQIGLENYLPRKVGETPIPHNGRISGYLPYQIVGITAHQFALRPADLFITFFDVNNRPYTVQGRWNP